MNDWLVWRLSFALIFGAAVTWVLYRTADPPDGRRLSLTFLGPENKGFHLTLQEDMAYTYLVNAPSFHQTYQVAGGVDWDCLDSLLAPV